MNLVDVEATLIGMALGDPSNSPRATSCGVSVDSFAKPEHKIIWAAIDAASRLGKRVDLASLEMRHGKDIAATAIACRRLGSASLAVEHFATIVASSCWRRSVAEAIVECGTHVSNATLDSSAEEMRERILALLNAVVDKGPSQATTLEPNIVLDNFTTATERAIRVFREGKPTGIPTGFDAIDKATGGWQPSTVNVIGARPSHGKTTLACNFAYNAAVCGHAVAYFTVEMRADRIIGKIISRMANVPTAAINRGSAPDWQLDRVENAVAELRSKNIRVNDKAGRDLDMLESEAWRLRRIGKLDLLIVDYVQQLNIRGKRFGSRQTELTEISARIQALAHRLEIPIIMLAQLNREADKDKTKPPNKSHLKDSGSLEQDADTVILIHREETRPLEFETTLIIDKNREGEVGHIPVDTDLAVSKIVTKGTLAL